MTVREQLEKLRSDFRDARAKITHLADAAPDAQWSARPVGGGWSAAECITHLTMTTNAYLPLLEAARARVSTLAPLPARYRREFGAWLLEHFLEPPARMRSKTIGAFVPGAADPKADTIAALARSQDALLSWIDTAQHTALDHAMITSPFNERLRYNAYAALCVMAAHQRRHLWQAERATRGIP